MVAAVSNAVAKDALCVNSMECGGKCVLFTLTGAYELQKMAAKYFEHMLAKLAFLHWVRITLHP